MLYHVESWLFRGASYEGAKFGWTFSRYNQYRELACFLYSRYNQYREKRSNALQAEVWIWALFTFGEVEYHTAGRMSSPNTKKLSHR
jgi:hypothetical protein